MIHGCERPGTPAYPLFRGLSFYGLFFVSFLPQREVIKHFDEDSRPREDKIIHDKVAKAAKTNHCRSLVETVLSSWPLCPCCEISGYLVAALPQCDLL
jgi:hypothetical protein